MQISKREMVTEIICRCKRESFIIRLLFHSRLLLALSRTNGSVIQNPKLITSGDVVFLIFDIYNSFVQHFDSYICQIREK